MKISVPDMHARDAGFKREALADENRLFITDAAGNEWTVRETARGLELMLNDVPDHRTHTTAVVVGPRASNVVHVMPLRNENLT